MRVAIDTNVLLRLIVDDNSPQVAAVERLARAHHLVIAPTTLLETEWVLRRVLRLDRKQAASGLEKLLNLDTATILQRDLVTLAIRAFASGCDFADALHALLTLGADVFATFDQAFVRRAKSLEFLPRVRIVPKVGVLTP